MAPIAPNAETERSVSRKKLTSGTNQHVFNLLCASSGILVPDVVVVGRQNQIQRSLHLVQRTGGGVGLTAVTTICFIAAGITPCGQRRSSALTSVAGRTGQGTNGVRSTVVPGPYLCTGLE